MSNGFDSYRSRNSSNNKFNSLRFNSNKTRGLSSKEFGVKDKQQMTFDIIKRVEITPDRATISMNARSAQKHPNY